MQTELDKLVTRGPAGAFGHFFREVNRPGRSDRVQSGWMVRVRVCG